MNIIIICAFETVVFLGVFAIYFLLAYLPVAFLQGSLLWILNASSEFIVRYNVMIAVITIIARIWVVTEDAEKNLLTRR